MKRGIICCLLALAVLLPALHGRAAAAVLTTRNQTFIGAAGTLDFTGGVPQCGTSTPGIDTLTLPAATVAPVSTDTQLSWTPTGSQSSAYEIAVIDPNGKTAVTWTIGVNSTAQVSYFKAGEPSGGWSFHESGLPSSICSKSALMGSPGTATGTAAWYEQK